MRAYRAPTDTAGLGQLALKTSHYNQVECNLVNSIKPWSRWRLIYWRENATNETDVRMYVTMAMQRAASPYEGVLSVACKVLPLSLKVSCRRSVGTKLNPVYIRRFRHQRCRIASSMSSVGSHSSEFLKR